MEMETFSLLASGQPLCDHLSHASPPAQKIQKSRDFVRSSRPIRTTLGPTPPRDGSSLHPRTLPKPEIGEEIKFPMAVLGRRNQLAILREASPGVYLDGGELGEILLPRRYMPADAAPGTVMDVFIYRDSEDRLVATTEVPLAMEGEFALLRVQSVKPSMGAFLDWGLSKDLLLPRREQVSFPREGGLVVVRVFIDEKSDRIVASERLDRWLDLTPPAYASEQPVTLLIARETPLGYSAIIENAHWGLLYNSDLAGPLRIGERINGFVRTVRPDGKIDLALDRAGFARIKPLTTHILDALNAAGGSLPFHDKSSPEEIRATFNVSKKAFKQALGILYKNRKINIDKDAIRIIKQK